MKDFDDIEFANRLLFHKEELNPVEVDKWLSDEKNKILLDEVVRINHAGSERSFSEIKENELCRLLAKTGKKKTLWYISYAASIFIIIFLSVFLYTQKVSEEMMISSSNNIPHVEFILASRDNMVIENTILEDSLAANSNLSVKVSTHDLDINIIKVPVGGFYKLLLPDSSIVWLNSATELQYSGDFNNSREVSLSGEAYFEVVKDLEKHFIVKTEGSRVTVLGTSFNVNAYKNESIVTTTLINGTVKFTSIMTDQDYILSPGMQSVMVCNNGETTLHPVEVSDYISWVNGRFVFKAMKMDKIMRQLQRWYDFEIVYEDDSLMNNEYRGAFNKDMDISNILEIIEETTDVQFIVEDKLVRVKKK